MLAVPAVAAVGEKRDELTIKLRRGDKTYLIATRAVESDVCSRPFEAASRAHRLESSGRPHALGTPMPTPGPEFLTHEVLKTSLTNRLGNGGPSKALVEFQLIQKVSTKNGP